ncbi:uncharacterized protein LOC132486759 [Mesoplodon densirostris]|uniref:uncharacterized protein LOC132486759 n=1 Tax=Mesoplodon densirostris TaxID=48708 RepID=UPI0028DC6ADD|nr:uncharacterized protein LOC132486759 [Mesoplodon densirostris]
MGGEHGGGVRAKRGAGPAGRCPTPRSQPDRRGKSLWAEEVLSKQRNAAWNLRDWGGEEGGGGAAEAVRPPASPPVSPEELPPPPARAAVPEKREEAALGGCFPVHFCRPRRRRRAPAPLPLLAAAHSAPSPACALSRIPSQPKCPETRRALRTCPAAVRRASRAGRCRPALVLLQPCGRRSRPARRRRAGELELAPAAALPRSRSKPGGAPARGRGHTREVDLANTPLYRQNR